jgi:hypothetical protein
MVLVSAMVQAKELVVTVDGKEVKMDCTIMNHEIKVSDKDKASQTNAMACSFLFYTLLAKGDIQGAARLSTDPARTVSEWTKYQARVGIEVFKKNIQDYFTSKNVVLAELVLADDTMLVVKTEDFTVGQFYQKKAGKYLVTETPFSDTLGKVLNMIQEGKIKL